MSKWEEWGITTYRDYFDKPHWLRLKTKHIFNNTNSRCHICTQQAINKHYLHKHTSNLLLHHLNYDNLFSEILYQDIVVLCFPCHEKCHFWFNGRVRVPLKPFWLWISLRLRKLIFYTQSRKYGLSVLYIALVIHTLFYKLVLELIKIIILSIVRSITGKWGSVRKTI